MSHWQSRLNKRHQDSLDRSMRGGGLKKLDEKPIVVAHGSTYSKQRLEDREIEEAGMYVDAAKERLLQSEELEKVQWFIDNRHPKRTAALLSEQALALHNSRLEKNELAQDEINAVIEAIINEYNNTWQQ